MTTSVRRGRCRHPVLVWGAAVGLLLPASAMGMTPGLSGGGPGLSGGTTGAVAPVPARPDTVVPPPREIPGLLASGEDRDRAMLGITARAGELSGRQATLWIQLLAVVEKSGAGAGALAATALLAADDGEPEEGAREILERLDGIVEEDRPPLLALAAHLLDGPDPARAAEVRERLLEVAPVASESPEAAFRLARYLAGPGQDRERAVELLQQMVVAAPNHAVAPTARQLLDELRRNP